MRGECRIYRNLELAPSIVIIMLESKSSKKQSYFSIIFIMGMGVRGYE